MTDLEKRAVEALRTLLAVWDNEGKKPGWVK